jgi:hypothetical protein
MTLTNSNMKAQTRATGRPAAARRATAPYQGAAGRGVVCQGASVINPGGLLIGRHSFQPEGVQRKDRRHLKN